MNTQWVRGHWRFHQVKGKERHKHHWIFCGPEANCEEEIHTGVTVGEIRQQPKCPNTVIVGYEQLDYGDGAIILSPETAELIVTSINKTREQ